MINTTDLLAYWHKLPVSYLSNSAERLYWLYLFLAGGIALIVFIVHHQRLPSWQTLAKQLRNKDFILDSQYFVVMWLIKVVMLAPLLISAHSVAMLVLRVYQQYLPPIPLFLSYDTKVLCYSIALFVVSDFTRYWLHRLLHSNRYLFAFHKVHHAAETLNPLTFYRIHPLESLLFGWRYALSAGLVTGLFMGMFQGGFHVYTLLGANALVVLFNSLGSNLRHSSIRLSYGKWLECLFISPSQHQLHHATRYMRHNYGGTLAIWDWLFGTLKRCDEVSTAQPIGLGSRQYQRYASVSKNLFTPILEVITIRQRRQKRRQPQQTPPSTSIPHRR